MKVSKNDFIKTMENARNARKENIERRALCATFEEGIERDASRADFFRDVCERYERDNDVVLHTMIH